jgi:hypothetical protein
MVKGMPRYGQGWGCVSHAKDPTANNWNRNRSPPLPRTMTVGELQRLSGAGVYPVIQQARMREENS